MKKLRSRGTEWNALHIATGQQKSKTSISDSKCECLRVATRMPGLFLTKNISLYKKTMFLTS